MTLLPNLISLFRIDSQVRGLRSRLESAQRYLDAQDRLLAELRDQREEHETRRRQLQATIGNLEVEMAVFGERIEKLRGELDAATTNKQYGAVLTEVNTAKLARTELEERDYEQMEKIEEIERQLKELEGNALEREKVRTVAEKQLRQRHDDVGERLAELETERNAAAAIIPGLSLKIFNELADSYDGEAMAQIEEIDRRRREYVCGSCNIQLQFESIASLLCNLDTLVRCTACDRILYLAEETRGALAKK